MTCGTGIQARVRICIFDSVAPRGKDCSGNSTDVQNCNTDLCPGLCEGEHFAYGLYKHTFPI